MSVGRFDCGGSSRRSGFPSSRLSTTFPRDVQDISDAAVPGNPGPFAGLNKLTFHISSKNDDGSIFDGDFSVRSARHHINSHEAGW